MTVNHTPHGLHVRFVGHGSLDVEGTPPTQRPYVLFSGTGQAGVASNGVELASIRFSAVGDLVPYLPSELTRWRPPDGYQTTPFENSFDVVLLEPGGQNKIGSVTGKVKLGSFSRTLNGIGNFNFTISISNPDNALITPPDTEVEVFYQGVTVWAGVVTAKREDSTQGTVNYICKDLRWYATRRHIGSIPKRNYVKDPDFLRGHQQWNRKGTTATSMEVRFVREHLTSEIKSSGFTGTFDSLVRKPVMASHPQGRGVELTQFATDYDDFLYQHFEWAVPIERKDGDRFTLTAWCYVPSRMWQGPIDGERGLFLELFSTTEPHPDPYLAARGFKASLKTVNVPINESTPKDRWVRMIAELEVPLKYVVNFMGNVPVPEKQVVSFRLHPTVGYVCWASPNLYWNERLVFNGVDQDLIIRNLVRHTMQSPNLGKSDLYIRTPENLSGVTRDRIYPFSDKILVDDALTELQRMERGPDIRFFPGKISDLRYCMTHYPHLGSHKARYALELGKNITSYVIETSGEFAANTVAIWSGREEEQIEVSAIDTTLYRNGLTLEAYMEATPNSAVTSLWNQAQRTLKRFGRPVPIVDVAVADADGTIYYKVLHEGDTVPVRIKNGATDLDADYRIIDISLDPNTMVTSMALVEKSLAYDVI